MPTCCVPGCSNSSDKDRKKGITFHRFPQKSEVKELWIAAVNRKNWRPSHSSVLCSKHFTEDQIDRYSAYKVRIKDNVVPSIFPASPSRMQKVTIGNTIPKRNTTSVSIRSIVLRPNMEAIDRIGEVQEELNIEWRIEDFISLVEEKDKFYTSFSFSFAGHSWCMRIYPNGREEQKSVGYIGLYLRRNSFGPGIKMHFSLGLKRFDGEKDPEKHCTHTFQKPDEGYGSIKLLSKSKLLQRKSDLLPADILTVFCSLTNQKSTENETNERLLNDFKSIMLSGDHSDTTIKVKGEEFRLHRSILASRNPFFHALFTCEMKEKVTGIIAIDDCEPDIFRSFIHFLYTGKVDKLSQENVCDLYEMADKYQEDQLKKECLHFMMNMVSVDSFCDFTILAIRHNENKLLQNVTEFFCSKAKGVMQSAKWETFSREYPTQANELQIKASGADDSDSDFNLSD